MTSWLATGGMILSLDDVHRTMELDRLYRILLAHFDVEEWWPSDSPFEVMVGAILTQQTNWKNVDMVLATIRSRGLLDPGSLADIDLAQLQGMVRPCGFYNQKAERIKGLAQLIMRDHEGRPEALLAGDIETARERLLAVRGIGKETADSILLFAGGRPVFVAAAYVSRVLARTGLLNSNDYDEVQDFVESRFPEDAKELARLYALFVQLAKIHCRPKPICEGCPLISECQRELLQGKK